MPVPADDDDDFLDNWLVDDFLDDSLIDDCFNPDSSFLTRGGVFLVICMSVGGLIA